MIQVGTRQWRKLRAQYAEQIAWAAALGNPIRCPRCGTPITPNDDWDLGHVIDRIHGGTENDGLRPECSPCNRRAGQATATQRRKGPRTRRW